MTPLARTWLRRIALGLPLVVAPAAVPLAAAMTGCTCPDHTRTSPIDGTQAATILDAQGVATVAGCRAVCDAIFVMPDAGAGADGGAFNREFGTARGCHVISESEQLEVRCEYPTGCIGGRRPLGLAERSATRISGAGAWLARMAWMEAASVDAFVELAADLERLRAPASLARMAREAARDEQRHARMIARLARARGADVEAPRRVAHAAPTLARLAHDNAVEGGVREAFGALLAALQAEQAPDRDVRDAMRTIARDEAGHALLSARIDAWARTRLDGTELDRARTAAAQALEASLVAEHDPALAAALGLGALETQIALVRALA